MSTCAAAQLHAHADAIEHAANLGGYMDQEGRGGPVVRRVLSPEQREAWVREAAVLREAAHALEAEEGKRE